MSSTAESTAQPEPEPAQRPDTRADDPAYRDVGEALALVDALNAARIDADTIGTDEFHLGAARLRELLAASL
jgi:2',3'-cyclic-nucleotide 2'-phosphodiesterase (5'-nucleotidase family)